MSPQDWVWYNLVQALWAWHHGREAEARLNVLASLAWAKQVQRERMGLRALPSNHTVN